RALWRYWQTDAAIHPYRQNLHEPEEGVAVTKGAAYLKDGRPWTIDSDSLVGSAHRRLHEELLDVARASTSCLRRIAFNSMGSQRPPKPPQQQGGATS